MPSHPDIHFLFALLFPLICFPSCHLPAAASAGISALLTPRIFAPLPRFRGAARVPLLLYLTSEFTPHPPLSPCPGPGAARVPLRVTVGTCCCRLLLLPLLGTAIVIGSFAAGFFTAPDPVFLLVMLIQVGRDLPSLVDL